MILGILATIIMVVAIFIFGFVAIVLGSGIGVFIVAFLIVVLAKHIVLTIKKNK